MAGERRVTLADFTTLRLGGDADRFCEVGDADALVEVVADIGRNGLLILGGGSNLVISDDGVDVPVVKVVTRGVTVDTSGSHVELTVAAGESWDDLVAQAVNEGWSGIEALSGIPGLVGATPIQNVGAYGHEVSDTITGVDVYDRAAGRRHRLAPEECVFAYRTSTFKREPDRYVVLAVHLRLERKGTGAPVRYAELARALGVESGSTAPLGAVRDAVLGLRRGKGMVLDVTDHDTWSAGSFFTNPVLAADATLPDGLPRWVQRDGRLKVSAAWLIEQSGFGKGFALEGGHVSLSTKHTLALTNRGGATTAELVALARVIRDGVHARFGITLVPEPTLVGVHL
jgi:UDP-N-acetylmuramate dehydrogenase